MLTRSNINSCGLIYLTGYHIASPSDRTIQRTYRAALKFIRFICAFYFITFYFSNRRLRLMMVYTRLKAHADGLHIGQPSRLLVFFGEPIL